MRERERERFRDVEFMVWAPGVSEVLQGVVCFRGLGL